MNRSLKYLLLVFLLFAAGNYFLMAAKSFFQNFVLFPAHGDTANTDYDYLPSVPVNFFSPSGVGNSYITQGYGHTPFAAEHTDIYPGGWHDGIDLAAPYGTPIYSPDAGAVLATGNQDEYCYHRAFGGYAAVRDAAGQYVLWYGHLGDIIVSPGETISKGTEIGTVGETGFETGPHLIFSLFEASGFVMTPASGCGPEPDGRDEDPIPYLENQ